MARNRIDKTKLSRMLAQGKSKVDCAQHFGVTKSAVTKAAKALNVSVVKNVVLENAHRVVSRNLNAVDQLYEINRKANGLLDAAVEADDNTTALSCMREIRGQLALQVDIFRVLYDLKAVQEFQHEVLSIIGEVSPGTRKKIIDRLREKRAIRNIIA